MKECFAVCIKNCYSARLCAFVTEFVQLDQIGPVFRSTSRLKFGQLHTSDWCDWWDSINDRLVFHVNFSALREARYLMCPLTRVRFPRVRLVPLPSRTGLFVRINHESTRQSFLDYPSGFDSSNAVIPSPLYFDKTPEKVFQIPFTFVNIGWPEIFL